MKVTRETTGTVTLSLEASQLEFAELCDALEAGRKTNAQKKLIEELTALVRDAAGLGEVDDAAE